MKNKEKSFDCLKNEKKLSTNMKRKKKDCIANEVLILDFINYS
jgi:hypothetical protein